MESLSMRSAQEESRRAMHSRISDEPWTARRVTRKSSLAVYRSCPFEEWGNRAEVDGLVRFLASDDAGYISGLAVNIDGGTVPC